MRRVGLVRCAGAAVLFGISTPAASRLADDLGPFTLAGLLYLGAALAVAPLVARRPPAPAAVRRTLPRLAPAVVLGGAVGPVLLAAGLRSAPAATVSLLLNLELAFTVAVAGLVLREHVGGRVAAGTVLVVAGGVALSWTGDAEVRWGALLVAGACACWAVDNAVTATIDQMAPADVTLVKGIVAGTANLVIGLATGGAPGTAAAVGALAVGAVGYGASITLWVAGARDLGAARAQVVFSTAPFIGAVVAWAALGERASAAEAIAFAAAAVGVAAVAGSDHGHHHRHGALRHDHEHIHDPHHDHDHDHDHGHDGHEHGRREGTGHRHVHDHRPQDHDHPHVPDLHHRHPHADPSTGRRRRARR